MAFLINAYNAFTVELILTRYPKLNRSATWAASSASPGPSATCLLGAR
jgi:hypothetical protein